MRRRGPYHRWTAEEDALLGTRPDIDIAARVGVSPNAVMLRRQARGIPPAPTEWRASTVLTQDQIDEIRREYARRGHGSRGRRPAGSGRLTIAEIAERYGVTEGPVRSAIVTPGRRRDESQPVVRRSYDWDSVRDRLGREPDGSIAADLGCHSTAVMLRRKALGIPAYSRRKTHGIA